MYLTKRRKQKLLRTNSRKHSKRVSSSQFITNEKLDIRYETLDEIRYLIAPVVMVREQVLNGEFLPAEEIEKSVPGWNGRPVVVYHPKKNNADASANDPEVVEKYEIGKLYNVEYDPETTKLKAEIWVDIARARKNDDTKAAYNMIKNSEELEVSTGYFVNDRVPEEGEFNGVEYIAIQKEILPDHLALLPNEIGACSWEDGAGVRNNTRVYLRSNRRAARGIKLNMDIPINQALQRALEDTVQDLGYIENTTVDDGITYVIYSVRQWSLDGSEKWPGIMYKQQYYIDMETGAIVLGDNPIEVEPVLQYMPVTNNKKEENTLSKKALVNQVIANSGGKWTRKDAPALNKMAEDVLVKMLPTAARNKFQKNNRPVRSKTKQRSNKRMSINEAMELPLDEIEDYVEELIDEADSGDDTAIADLEELETELIQEEVALADVIDVIEEYLDEEPMGDPQEDPEENSRGRRSRRNKGRGKSGRARRANLDTSEITDPDVDEFEDDEVELVDDLATAQRKRQARKNKRARARKNEDLEQLLDDEEIEEVVELDPSNEAQEVMAQQLKTHKAQIIKKIVANSDFRAVELKKYKLNTLVKMAGGMGIDITSMATNANYGIRGVQMRSNAQDDLGYTPLSNNIFKPKK